MGRPGSFIYSILKAVSLFLLVSTIGTNANSADPIKEFTGFNLDRSSTPCFSELSVDPLALCSDLYSTMCSKADGDYFDGTGWSYSRASLKSDLAKSAQGELPFLKEKIATLLKDPRSGPSMLEAFGLDQKRLNDPSVPLELANHLSESVAKSIEKNGRFLDYEDTRFNSLGFRVFFEGYVEKVLQKYQPTLEQRRKIAEKIVFPQVKKLIEEEVSARVQDPSTRKRIVDIVESRELEIGPCKRLEVKMGILDSLGLQAAFSDTTEKIHICDGFLLASTSEFQMAAILGHELTHAIDPCRITRDIDEAKGTSFPYHHFASRVDDESDFPIKNVVSCLRLPSSANTRYENDELLPATIPAEYGGGVSLPKKPTFCYDDQVIEAFPDWMSFEVLPKYMARFHPELTSEQYRVGYSKIFSALCELRPDTELSDALSKSFDEHPSMKSRVNRILLANPMVRAQMGCPSTKTFPYTHCG
jgi:hypothetical protein